MVCSPTFGNFFISLNSGVGLLHQKSYAIFKDISLFLMGCAIYQNFKEFSKLFSYTGSIEKYWSRIDF